VARIRAAIYARVSMAEKQDPEMQNRELVEFCDRSGWKDPIILVDRMSSGKIRPELEKLKQLCRHRKIDVVVVYRYDRFARSAVELHNALEEFRSLGVEFISLRENVDTRTPTGKLMFAIFAGFAEFEKAIIHERVMSGLANARAKGRIGGRRRKDVDVDKIRQLRRNGVAWRDIVKLVGVSLATAKRALLMAQKPLSERLQ